MTTLGQVKKVVTGLIWKITAIVAGIITLGGVTTYYLVIGQSNSISGKIEGVKGELSQGLSQVQAAVVTGLNVTRKGLTAEIEEIRTDTREENQITGDKINRQRADILRTGNQVEAQAAKIEAQTVEIKELREAIAELQAGIEVIREEVTRPTPAPAATVPKAEEADGWLGIF
jgi:predicted RNase H-like nuclease (RuvC/YqgF family)